jgi:hypothetical protein
MVKVMAGCPAKMGFRMPAEWEPHEQCWMGWPVRTPPSPFLSSIFCLLGSLPTAFFALLYPSLTLFIPYGSF